MCKKLRALTIELRTAKKIGIISHKDNNDWKLISMTLASYTRCQFKFNPSKDAASLSTG